MSMLIGGRNSANKVTRIKDLNGNTVATILLLKKERKNAYSTVLNPFQIKL